MDGMMKMGRLGGVALLGAGVLLIAAFFLEIAFLEVGHVVLLGIGLAFVLVGLLRLVFRTADERIAELVDEELPMLPITVDQVRALPLPFYVCTACRVQIQTDVICPKCLGSAWCTAVESEADRQLVVAALE